MTPVAKASSAAIAIGSDTKAVLFAAGLIFIGALLLGVWKYRQMAASPDGLAHPYVDTAHRAALLYSFAALLIAAFVELSGWSSAVNLIAAFAVIAFFVGAISGYIYNGITRDTDNRFRDGDELPGQHAFMWALIVAELGGFGVLLAGFVSEQIF
jgi:phosphatidylglycerophosphate synthase